MLEVLRKELEKYDAFSPPDHDFINALIRAVPFSTVPQKMKLVFAITHLSNFASQFRRNMELWDGTMVPTNCISFVVADSGANKDSSNNKVKKCFEDGINTIREAVKEFVKEDAIERAEKAGEETPEEYSVWIRYSKPIPPVFMSITTGPGLVQHINDIGALPALSGMVYTGEFSDELAHNVNTLENIKILAEMYDLGNKESSYTKGVEFRTGEVSGQPVSALFVGSPGHILYDETTRKKFDVAFMSKLARRSWFCYTPERVPNVDFSTEKDPIRAMQAYENAVEQEARAAVNTVKAQVVSVTEHNLVRNGEAIPTDEKVFELFNVYKRYNQEVIDAMPGRQENAYALVRAHLQWKALKLAGALAVIECTGTVTAEQYVTAIRFCELFDQDIAEFGKDLNKAPHENLSDYLRTQINVDNKAFISIHDIKKHGFSSSVTFNKLQEMVALCAGYDQSGVYTVGDNGSGIIFEPIIKTDVVRVSYKEVDNSKVHSAIAKGDAAALKKAKEAVAYTANRGYEVDEATFADLATLLEGDFAYSPFVFIDGVRSKDGIVGGTKWVVFDVDKTTLSNEDAHFLLENINHHIALTSDPNNVYKYRVLVELDAPVELSGIAWKHFYTRMAEDLGLEVDVLPQSQLYISYSDRTILSCVDGQPVETRDYVMYAKQKEGERTPEKMKELSTTQKSVLLDQPLETFYYAFNCEKGGRSTTIYRAVRHAKDLGADQNYVIDLIDQINEYLVEPMEEDRTHRLKEQVINLYKGA